MNLFRKSLEDRTKAIREEQFISKPARVIPTLDSSDLTFNNVGKWFYATILYIDIRHSSQLLENHHYDNVAKLLSAFYNAIVRVANQDDGKIRSFNGDSLLVFYMGTEEETITKAIRSAMKMSYAIKEIINPLMKKLTNLDFGIGIDYGKVLAKKVGISGGENKDLIWIGNGVNRATKISDKCRAPYHIGISDKLFRRLAGDMVYSRDSHGQIKSMWVSANISYNGQNETIYKTSYYMEI